ncbi:uncharacterized protein N7503_000149 [Penicillium pulvis]|uniref:uncharacterized protein n=1 Tax=Penicillium pulvis TaxID=1562058 RepID=UPI002547F641|nr:uncharacterized protein N7503_000149 [Penicillium pulvis]KAJ5813399.1 hypothetical protein N7503_000149 [Penicillium pulvis]
MSSSVPVPMSENNSNGASHNHTADLQIDPVIAFEINYKAPGEISKAIMTLPWSVARKENVIKSELLKALITMTPVREPVLRASRIWTNKQLHEQLSKVISNAESAIIQTVGRVPTQKCKPCSKDLGPWTQCVVIDDMGHLIKACGNCHWRKKDSRCDFCRTAPLPSQQRAEENELSLAVPSIPAATATAVPSMTTQYTVLDAEKEALYDRNRLLEGQVRRLEAQILVHCAHIRTLEDNQFLLEDSCQLIRAASRKNPRFVEGEIDDLATIIRCNRMTLIKDRNCMDVSNNE